MSLPFHVQGLDRSKSRRIDRMKSLAMVLCGLLLGLGAWAQDHSAHMQSHPVALVSGLGDLRHPVSTKNAEAQKFFDQGLRFIYAFDHDAATLFAESGMNLHPWGLWNQDGTPIAGTEEIVSTLESVIKRDPNHLGAIHYYIHAVEASNNPDRALSAADRLPRLAPGAGHIVHMPAHIYIRTGDYEAAVQTNQKAAEVDRTYIKQTGAQGIYPMMYYSHNLHFVAMCGAMNGRYPDARKNAD